MVVDMHIHPFDRHSRNICRFDGVVPDVPETLREDLVRTGIDLCCGSVIDDISCWDDIKALNDTALALKKLYNGFYVPGYHIHPDYPKESCAEIERMCTEGVYLIGELVPYRMSWNGKGYACDELTEVFTLAQEKGVAVNVHPTTPEDMDAFAAKYPRLSIIEAHPGDGNTYLTNLERLARFPNLYQDLSGTGMFRYGMLRHGIDKVGSERFMFGSDYPICSPGMNLHGVLYEKLNQSELENVLYKNAARVLKLP